MPNNSKSSIKSTQLSNRGQTTLPAKFGRRIPGLSGFYNHGSAKCTRTRLLGKPTGSHVTNHGWVASGDASQESHNTSGSPRFRRTARGFETTPLFPSSLPFHPVAAQTMRPRKLEQAVAEKGEVTPMASLFVFNKFSMLKILEVSYFGK